MGSVAANDEQAEVMIADDYLRPALERLHALSELWRNWGGRSSGAPDSAVIGKARAWLYTMCNIAIKHKVDWRNPILTLAENGDWISAEWVDRGRRLLLTVRVDDCLIVRSWPVDGETETVEARLMMASQGFYAYLWVTWR